MANDDMNPMIDEGMLELFRMEAEMHAAALESGLMELEADPSSAKKIEPLMRAAHSIKGAARIMGLDIPVTLAHIMEDVFTSAQEGKTALDASAIDTLLLGVDLFKRLSMVKADKLSSWLKEHQDEIRRLEESIREILSPAPQPAEPVAPAIEPQAQQPAEKESAEAFPPIPELRIDSAVAVPQSPADPPSSGDELNPMIDEGMLELFRMEAEMHAASLESGLMELEADPSSAKKIEPLMRAAHSIKGAARIMGLDIAVTLAHIMEDVFTSAQEGKTALDASAIDTLLLGVDLFKRLSTVKADKLSSWLREHQAEIRQLEGRIKEILSPAPQPAAAVPPMAPATPPLAERPPERKPEEPAPPSPAAQPGPATATPKTADTPSAAAEEKDAPGSTESLQSGSDNAILVTADNLSRLVGLAGECMVESQGLRSQVQELYNLKALLADVHRMFEAVRTPSRQEDHYELCKDVCARAQKRAGKCRDALSRQIESFETYLLHWENLSNRLYNEAVATRMRPFRDGAHGFPRMVRDMARKLGKKIKLRISGQSTRVDRDVLVKLEAPLTHILRNACDHGIEAPEVRKAAGKPERAVIDLKVAHRAGMLSVVITDDGRGIDPERIRARVVEKGMVSQEMAARLTEAELMDFLFLSGFTTVGTVTEISGRGVGLDVVQNMVQEVRGTMKVQSAPGRGTSFHMELPLTLSVIRTLLVEIGGELYAFPLTRLDRVLTVPRNEIEVIEERQYFPFEGDNIGLVSACQPLGLKVSEPKSEDLPVAVISDRLKQYGVVVDKLVGEVDMVVRPLDQRLGKIPNISAASISEDGAPVLIIDVDDLVRSIDNLLTGGRLTKIDSSTARVSASRVKRILVVDDSITVREVERRLLENKGYEVEVAVDGMDGLNAVLVGKYDLVISDVDMPRMNGIELVANIRSNPETKHLPVIILSYKDREEDRLKGLQAGASCYLTKSSFYDQSFLKSVLDLAGEPR